MRCYGAVIGKWMTPDPLADLYPGWSPYNYVLGNPLRFIDPDGREVQESDEEEKRKKKPSVWDRIRAFFDRFRPDPDNPPTHTDLKGTIDDIRKAIVGESELTEDVETLIGSADGGGTPPPPDPKGLALQNILRGAERGKVSSSKQYEKSGGEIQLRRDFESLPGSETETYPNGVRVKNLPDGSRAVMYPRSTEGSPTLEIQSLKGKPTKIRYKD